MLVKDCNLDGLVDRSDILIKNFLYFWLILGLTFTVPSNRKAPSSREAVKVKRGKELKGSLLLTKLGPR